MNEIDAALSKLSIRNQKCDNGDDNDTDDADEDIIPICRPCFTGDTINLSRSIRS